MHRSLNEISSCIIQQPSNKERENLGVLYGLTLFVGAKIVTAVLPLLTSSVKAGPSLVRMLTKEVRPIDCGDAAGWGAVRDINKWKIN